MKTAVYIALILFRIAASYSSLVLLAWELDHIVRVYSHGRVEVVLGVWFCLFWASGIFPTAKLMLRRQGSRRVLMLLLATGFAFHDCRFLLPLRYMQLVYGDNSDVNFLYSGQYWLIALYGFVPPVVCFFEYLWMRHCKKALLEPIPAPLA